jgi:hypothetical protein
MKIIITESQYNRIVQEVSVEFEEGLDLTDTYLDYTMKPNYEKRGHKISGIDGISFEKITADYIHDEYHVIFSDEFINTHFKSIKDNNNILSKIIITSEGLPKNRIHFSDGIPEELRGYGLGYLIYKSFIKFLGWASSTPSATPQARNIWEKIANDNEFYSIYFEGYFDPMIVSITRNKFDENKIIRIILDIVTRDFSNKNPKIKFDDDLLEDYPDIDKKIQEKTNGIKDFSERMIKLQNAVTILEMYYEEDIDNEEKNEIVSGLKELTNYLKSNDNWADLIKGSLQKYLERLQGMEDDLNEYASNNKNFGNYQYISSETIRLIQYIIDKIKKAS